MPGDALIMNVKLTQIRAPSTPRCKFRRKFTTIVWTIKDDGGTGATLDGNILRAQSAGTVTITATIVNGLGLGTDHVQDFEITVVGGGGGTDADGPNMLLIAAVIAAVILIVAGIYLFVIRKR